MANRRQFIKNSALAVGGAALLRPIEALASRYQAPTGYFGLHPFIEQHPEAVFIMKTAVDQKMNSEAKKEAGLAFGRSVFVPWDNTGIPVNIPIAVKPNIKTGSPSKHPLEEIISHTSDSFFVEGTLEGMKELGIAGSQFHLREVTQPEYFGNMGYVDMANRVGADLRTDIGGAVTTLQIGRDFNWVDVPDGIFYKRIPYLEPINSPNIWQMNISKLKAHGMGLTLCCKCIQGSVANPYQQFCADYGARMSIDLNDRQPNAYSDIQANFNRHVGSIPRWDRPGKNFNSGLGMETWVTRTLDNISASKYGIHIIEGIYGRDGEGNEDYGPNPQDQAHTFDAVGVSTDGKAWDYMTNVIIFGKDTFRVDIIGHWLGGHEPGNMGLFHCAIDRGMSTALDPKNIPVYIWDNGTATLTPLENLTRTPLLTYYLTRNYNGQTEGIYHLCNEPFDYPPETPVSVAENAKPEAFVLAQNKPNPFNPSTSIEYSLPKSGYARLEVYNTAGQLVDVLVDGLKPAGSHMAVWNTSGRASGTYFYRFRFGGFSETKKMTLLK
jgi:hypothetical protein